MVTALDFPIQKKSVYNYPNRFVVSRWGTDSCFNNEQINGLSGPFGSRVRSRYIENNTYTGIRGNLRSKPTTIHGPDQKSDLNY